MWLLPSHRTIGHTDYRPRPVAKEGRAPLSVGRPVTQSMADPTIDHEIGDGKTREDRRKREGGEMEGAGAPRWPPERWTFGPLLSSSFFSSFYVEAWSKI